MYRIMSSANRHNFTSSFPIWIHVISLPHLISLAQTSSTMLSKSGRSGQLSEHNQKSFQFFTIEYRIRYGLLNNGLFILREYPSFPNLVSIFIIK